MRELRFAFRRLLKHPLQLAAGLPAFALGIGVNTAMFSLADAVLYHPLDLPAIDRLAVLDVSIRGAGHDGNAITPADYPEFRAGSKSFSSLSCLSCWDATITRGRGIAAGEDQPGKNGVVVLSEGL